MTFVTEDEKESALREELMSAQREVRGFSSDQMVACEKCERANAPTRLNCLYCGATLPVTETNVTRQKPILRRLEEWETGFNAVLVPTGSMAEASRESLAEAADLLRLEPEHLQQVIEAREPLPLARAASREEAALIEKRLGAHGFRIEIVPDESLSAEALPPKRIRRLELADDAALTGWTILSDEALQVPWAEIILLVRGRIFTKRVEVEERPTRGARRNEMVEARELVADEEVLDLYSSGREEGWRIEQGSFDFSCLGARKSLLATENFHVLTEVMRERAPVASYDDSYWSRRHLLVPVWPLTERTESRLRRARPGRLNTEAVTSMSNQEQFTRYSRLRYRFGSRRRHEKE